MYERASAGLSSGRGGPVDAGVLERVVQLVDVAPHRVAAADVAHQPELLLVADVGQIPHQRRHERRVLADQVVVVDRAGQQGRAFAGALQLRRHPGAQPFGLDGHCAPPALVSAVCAGFVVCDRWPASARRRRMIPASAGRMGQRASRLSSASRSRPRAATATPRIGDTAPGGRHPATGGRRGPPFGLGDDRRVGEQGVENGDRREPFARWLRVEVADLQVAARADRREERAEVVGQVVVGRRHRQGAVDPVGERGLRRGGPVAVGPPHAEQRRREGVPGPGRGRPGRGVLVDGVGPPHGGGAPRVEPEPRPHARRRPAGVGAGVPA
jgi:hypothetical protein